MKFQVEQFVLRLCFFPNKQEIPACLQMHSICHQLGNSMMPSVCTVQTYPGEEGVFCPTEANEKFLPVLL